MRVAPVRTLVLDCETTTDPTQRLLFGVYRFYIDARDLQPGGACHAEGIFYADDLPDRDPDGMEALRRYVAEHAASVAPGARSQLALLSRTEFVDRVFHPIAYEQQATVVGFNLPFDLARLATHAARARKANRGGISLRLWEYQGRDHPYRPRLVLRTIDHHRTLIQFTSAQRSTDHHGQPRRGQHYRGRFLDLRTLAFAHTDRRGLSLERACDLFASPYTKRDVDHGTITDEYITYCREDVAATAELFRALIHEHDLHPIDLPAHHAQSAATVAKGYYRKMGITPYRERQDWLDDEINGWGAAAFFGGRTECRIQRTRVPIVYCDFLSMYMTCNALMDTWRLMTADHLIVNHTTSEIRDLLADPNLPERCFDPALWTKLHTLVEIEPNGAIVPVRARYDNQTWGIGVNPYQSQRSCWYPFADLIANRLLGGPPPTVLRAITLTPSAPHPNLRTTKLLRQIEINPVRDDFFAATVEHRHRTRKSRAIPSAERQRLATFLKVLANSSGYGILVQYDRKAERAPVDITVHTDRQAFTIRTDTPEDAADYTTPALAACVTGAARLMLALLDHEVASLGGTYAFCDTDSMAIVATRHGAGIPCPGGPHTDEHDAPMIRALSWRQVTQIVRRFEALNPYDRDAVPGSILKIEDENFDQRRRQRQLWCYAISSKRYQLTDQRGEIIKRSEHGLGHLLNPTRDGSDWITAAWRWITDPHATDPDWLDMPALSRMTVASADAVDWFAHLNQGRSYADQIKPGSFLLIAYPDALNPCTAHPIAPYEPNPDRWHALDWIDRATGEPVTITTRPLDGHDRPATCRVRTYRDVLTGYRRHPEPKALAPDGQPVTGMTAGLLRRRPVQGIDPITYIGKEAHDLDNRTHGVITADADTTVYAPPNDEAWRTLIVPTLRRIPTAHTTRETGVNRRTIQRALNGRKPHPAVRQRLHEFAVHFARGKLGAKRTEADYAVIFRFLQSP